MSEQARPAEAEPHQARQVAESFGEDARRYDRSRPSYPEAMVERIVAASPGPDLVDVGCGTGIVARQFRAAGCQVLGVEVDERMADLARQAGFEVEVAKFEEWDPAGRTFDAVLAGQAWHWVDPIAGAAKAAEALRPGGLLAVFWNVHEPPADLAAGFAEVYRTAVTGLPFTPYAASAVDLYHEMCGKAEDGIRQAGGFGEPERWRLDWERPYTRDEWLDQVPTHGGHSRLPPAVQQEVLAGMGSVIDAAGGVFTMRYATMVVTATQA